MSDKRKRRIRELMAERGISYQAADNLLKAERAHHDAEPKSVEQPSGEAEADPGGWRETPSGAWLRYTSVFSGCVWRGDNGFIWEVMPRRGDIDALGARAHYGRAATVEEAKAQADAVLARSDAAPREGVDFDWGRCHLCDGTGVDSRGCCPHCRGTGRVKCWRPAP